MSKEIVTKTAHRFNWAQLGAAVQHPDQGKVFDMSDAVNQELGIDDAWVRVYPFSGYGNPEVIRHLLNLENPDGILHFTDPRFWIWLYDIEHEVRQHCPLFFYHIWDDTPYPRYNENYYRSCDWIACISKQTYNIVKQVWHNGKDKNQVEPWQIKYIPHGVDSKLFKKLTTEEELKIIAEKRKKLFGDAEVDFVMFWNNRNIRRKMMGDVLLAFQHFTHQLTKDEAARCRLVMHTQPIDDNGTDLPAVIRDVTPDIKVVFSTDRLDTAGLNVLYNIADITINLASNEGFGIGTLESLMAETPIIVNVTGGMQDQCGFVDDDGNYLDPDIHYNTEFGTNAVKKYTKHGKWVKPVWPAQRALIGSPPTPYIFDDRADWKEAGEQILKWYKAGKEKRDKAGKAGRKWAIEHAQMTAQQMADLFVEGMDEALGKWKKPPKVRLIKV